MFVTRLKDRQGEPPPARLLADGTGDQRKNELSAKVQQRGLVPCGVSAPGKSQRREHPRAKRTQGIPTIVTVRIRRSEVQRRKPRNRVKQSFCVMRAASVGPKTQQRSRAEIRCCGNQSRRCWAIRHGSPRGPTGRESKAAPRAMRCRMPPNMGRRLHPCYRHVFIR